MYPARLLPVATRTPIIIHQSVSASAVAASGRQTHLISIKIQQQIQLTVAFLSVQLENRVLTKSTKQSKSN